VDLGPLCLQGQQPKKRQTQAKILIVILLVEAIATSRSAATVGRWLALISERKLFLVVLLLGLERSFLGLAASEGLESGRRVLILLVGLLKLALLFSLLFVKHFSDLVEESV
jgi:hypothetical protein